MLLTILDVVLIAAGVLRATRASLSLVVAGVDVQFDGIDAHRTQTLVLEDRGAILRGRRRDAQENLAASLEGADLRDILSLGLGDASSRSGSLHGGDGETEFTIRVLVLLTGIELHGDTVDRLQLVGFVGSEGSHLASVEMRACEIKE